MSDSTFPRLLGDIGGTHARFAWQQQADAAITDIARYPTHHATLEQAIRQYLEEHRRPQPAAAALGIANPVSGDHIQMTNHAWSFSVSALKQRLGLGRLVVLNDFTALALALPTLNGDDLRPIGAGVAEPGASMAVLGPGTGLGVSGLIADGRGGWAPISGEGGHVTLAAGNDHERAIIEQLSQRFDHVSAERVLSGPGLVNLYEAQCALIGVTARPLQPAEIAAHARTDEDPACSAALQLFFALLGSVAGNLALTLGARAGVFIGGGIAPKLFSELERSEFRVRFESKGRFADYLRPIPTWVIDARIPPALLGAAKTLD
jgi:glucokinase